MGSPGRPRAKSGTRRGNSPSEEILDAAAELFTTLGYSGTSTRAIAEAVGVRQASIYTHFASKAAMLNALLQGTVRDMLELVENLSDDISPQEQLFTLAHKDISQLLAGKWNIGILYLLPEVAGEEFAEFRKIRSALRFQYRRLAKECRPDLIDSSAELDLPFRIVESAISQRQDQPAEPIDPTPWSEAALRSIGIEPPAHLGG